MSERKPMLLRVEVEPVPKAGELSPEDWHKWCEHRGFRSLGDTQHSRRAWIGEPLRTYLRDADVLVWYYDGLVALSYADDDDLVGRTDES